MQDAMFNFLGYAASGAVLGTFLMRGVVPLRLMAILSNVLFATFGLMQHIYPVLFLHMAVLPINIWRLAAHQAVSGLRQARYEPGQARAQDS